eukprot:TRINITY_DN1253_c0_g1_i1.p1 TRINITY_DN1253_c0_g1~~TRINITY_DN1253_c0_g1_i1.p1  ORF type:complete len:418 (-),score=50.94 TRINITY_DN1253_c0_g1_i1:61-1314(-)
MRNFWNIVLHTSEICEIGGGGEAEKHLRSTDSITHNVNTHFDSSFSSLIKTSHEIDPIMEVDKKGWQTELAGLEPLWSKCAEADAKYYQHMCSLFQPESNPLPILWDEIDTSVSSSMDLSAFAPLSSLPSALASLSSSGESSGESSSWEESINETESIGSTASEERDLAELLRDELSDPSVVSVDGTIKSIAKAVRYGFHLSERMRTSTTALQTSYVGPKKSADWTEIAASLHSVASTFFYPANLDIFIPLYKNTLITLGADQGCGFCIWDEIVILPYQAEFNSQVKYHSVHANRDLGYSTWWDKSPMRRPLSCASRDPDQGDQLCLIIPTTIPTCVGVRCRWESDCIQLSDLPSCLLPAGFPLLNSSLEVCGFHIGKFKFSPITRIRNSIVEASSSTAWYSQTFSGQQFREHIGIV